MRHTSVKGLLVAVAVLLVLNLVAQYGVSAAKGQAPVRGGVVGITSVVRGDTLFLFRTFENGRTEAMSTQFDVSPTPADRSGPLILKPAEPWAPVKMKDAQDKPK